MGKKYNIPLFTLNIQGYDLSKFELKRFDCTENRYFNEQQSIYVYLYTSHLLLFIK